METRDFRLLGDVHFSLHQKAQMIEVGFRQWNSQPRLDQVRSTLEVEVAIVSCKNDEQKNNMGEKNLFKSKNLFDDMTFE